MSAKNYIGPSIDSLKRKIIKAGCLRVSTGNEKSMTKHIIKQIISRIGVLTDDVEIIKVIVPIGDANMTQVAIGNAIAQLFPSTESFITHSGSNLNVKVILKKDEKVSSIIDLGIIPVSTGNPKSKKKNMASLLRSKFEVIKSLNLDEYKTIEVIVPVHNELSEVVLKEVLEELVPEFIPELIPELIHTKVLVTFVDPHRLKVVISL